MAPTRDRYHVAIVGGGIIGLFTAYHLARAGGGPIAVFDRGFLSSGASGRNGGGVRQQWETPATVRLAREAVEAYRRFGREFGYNIWFRQGGYLFLATDSAETARLDRMYAAVSTVGLPIQRVRPEELDRFVPGLDPAGIVGGTYLPSDGTLYPFPAVWGVYEAARSFGVDVQLGTEVLGVSVHDGKVGGVTTSNGPVRADWVVNAAGGWSAEISGLAGLDVPNVATRHEILATEPLKPFLDPMVTRLRDGLYLSQTMRGEIVGGLTVPHPTGTARGMPSSVEFLRRMARALVGLLPRLGSLRVLRAWTGFYDDTPDGLPLLGEDRRLKGFVHANGLGGHGFMLAPAVSRRVAGTVLGERVDLDPLQFGPDRFLASGRAYPAERIQLG